MTGLQIRPCRKDWAAFCAALHDKAFARGWSTAEIDTLLSDPAVVADAALDGAGRRVFGFAMSRLAADEAEVLTIVVDHGNRARGIGRQLLTAHMERLSVAGIGSLYLEVAADNTAALALYRKLDFQKVGERPGYYRTKAGTFTNALILNKKISIK